MAPLLSAIFRKVVFLSGGFFRILGNLKSKLLQKYYINLEERRIIDNRFMPGDVLFVNYEFFPFEFNNFLNFMNTVPFWTKLGGLVFCSVE